MTTTVEARGVLCPVPIIRLARVAASLPPGSHIALLTDDPAAEHDVPAWCRLRGHALLSSEPLVGPGAPLADRAAPPQPEPALPAAATDVPEPHVPNPQPGQPVRHLIRLGPSAGTAAEPGSVVPSGTGAGPSTGPSSSARPSSVR